MGAWRRRLRVGSAVLLLGTATGVGTTLALPAGAGAASTAPSKAPLGGQVYLVQGLVGTPVAAELDGRQVVASAQPKTIVGPLSVPAGPHVLVLRTGTSTITSARFTVVAGHSVDVVAHRAADAAQTARVVVFANDLSPVGPGKARLVVAHAAVAPPADIRVSGSVLFHDVASGESLSLLVPAKAYSVDVVASVGGATILAPVQLSVKAGTLTRVFAVGDPSNGTADAVVQVLPVNVSGAGRPSRVPTGDGGQAADSFVGDSPVRLPLLLLGAGAGVLLVLRTGRRVAGLAPRRHVR